MYRVDSFTWIVPAAKLQRPFQLTVYDPCTFVLGALATRLQHPHCRTCFCFFNAPVCMALSFVFLLFFGEKCSYSTAMSLAHLLRCARLHQIPPRAALLVSGAIQMDL